MFCNGYRIILPSSLFFISSLQYHLQSYLFTSCHFLKFRSNLWFKTKIDSLLMGFVNWANISQGKVERLNLRLILTLTRKAQGKSVLFFLGGRSLGRFCLLVFFCECDVEERKNRWTGGFWTQLSLPLNSSKTFLFSRIHFWVELNFDHGVTDPLVYLKSTAFFISFVVELKWPLTCEVKLYSCCYLWFPFSCMTI